jgi:leucyl aminopeptidase (aminopeptidase T)
VAGERFLLVVDASTKHLAPRFVRGAEALGATAEVIEIDVADRHGKEPGEAAAGRMQQAHLVAGLTKMSLAHTRARQKLCAGSGRYLSLAGYSEQLLDDPCIVADYHGQFRLTRAIADAFTAGRSVHVTGPAGTDMRLGISGREGNCCPGFVDAQYRLGSPPDIEANVSPVEDESEGVAVIDGSVACDAIGLVDVPITLQVAGGRIANVTSTRPEYVARVNELFAAVNNPKSRILAECGVGLNPLAQLTGNMLTDEGALGCVHFGFGSNITVGGRNDVPFHVDFVFRHASLWIDERQILDAGRPCI